MGAYGKAKIKVLDNTGLLKGLDEEEVVWDSHGDIVSELPEGFKTLAYYIREGPFKNRIDILENKEKQELCIVFTEELAESITTYYKIYKKGSNEFSKDLERLEVEIQSDYNYSSNSPPSTI